MVSSAENVFHSKPTALYVDEDYSAKPPPYGKVELLVRSLKQHGPLVAVGSMGPEAYEQAPFKLPARVSDHDIYGWKPGSAKKTHVQATVILLGIKRQTEPSIDVVYYVLANDMTPDSNSLIRKFQPSATDTKVYVMSYNNFLNTSELRLHAICPHAEWLFTTISLNSILGETEKACHQIGQQIFDHYKKTVNGRVARNAVIRICKAAQIFATDGAVRTKYIERAWNGIGDEIWKWQK